MNKATRIITIAAIASGGAIAAQQAQRARHRMVRAIEGWHVITVKRDISNVVLGTEELKPLTDLGSAVEVRISAAPGGKTTEIAGRLKQKNMDPPTAKEMLGKLRSALRRTQSLLETGEALRPGMQPSTRPSPMNWPLRFASRYGREGGGA